MKTSSSADAKYLQRLPRWKLRSALLGMALCLVAGVTWQLSQPPRGTAVYLQEGRFRVATVLDPITFECEPLDDEAGSKVARGAPPLTIRLWGVALLDPQRPGGAANAAALRCTLEFLRQAPGGVVELRFEPYRFDRQLVPLARMFAAGSELNQRLRAGGWVTAAPIPGERAAAEPLRRDPRRTAAPELPPAG